MEVFAVLGMTMVIFVAILLFTWLIGWASGDDQDFCLRWVFTCMLYGITVTLLVMKMNNGA